MLSRLNITWNKVLVGTVIISLVIIIGLLIFKSRPIITNCDTTEKDTKIVRLQDSITLLLSINNLKKHYIDSVIKVDKLNRDKLIIKYESKLKSLNDKYNNMSNDSLSRELSNELNNW